MGAFRSRRPESPLKIDECQTSCHCFGFQPATFVQASILRRSLIIPDGVVRYELGEKTVDFCFMESHVLHHTPASVERFVGAGNLAARPMIGQSCPELIDKVPVVTLLLPRTSVGWLVCGSSQVEYPGYDSFSSY